MIFVVSAGFSQKIVLKKEAIYHISSLLSINNKAVGVVQPTPQSILPSGFYFSKLSFFCKQEIKVEKIIKVPFRFRLGSIESCDQLEGKYKRN